MKFIYSTAAMALFGTLTFSLPVLAAPVSPEQAMNEIEVFNRLNSKMVRRAPAATSASSMRLVYSATSDDGDNCFYVFNHGVGSGFTIVSADDRLPVVLGFSDSGNFDPDNIPANMAWWLGEYRLQIERFLEADPDVAPVRQRAMVQDHPAVAPMVKTTWNQDAPYNNDCPYDIRANAQSVTGCVATAMAQIMNFHQWPVNPTGTAPDGFQFSGTTLDWDNMLDSYDNGNYNSAQAKAVAQLMRQCGASVEMMYSAYESGAYSENVQGALRKYFDYSPSLAFYWRDYHTMNEWNEIVYSEIGAGRPVYYSGSSTLGGHAFVCDGYLSNGYFHFNWGWGGYQDGYFLLNALNPNSGGIGSYAGGYNTGQQILTGIKKNEGETRMQEAALATGSFVYGSGEFYIKDDPQNYNMIYNPLMTDMRVTFGVKVSPWDDPENAQYFSSGSSTSLQPLYGFKKMSVSISGLSNGKYRVAPAFRNSYGEWEDVGVAYGKQRFVTLNVNGSNYSYSNDGPNADGVPHLLSGLPQSTEVIYGDVAPAFRLVVNNVTNHDFAGEVGLTFIDAVDPFGDAISLYNRMLVPGEMTASYEFIGDRTILPGEYEGYIMTAEGDMLCEPFTVTITNIGAQEPTYNDLDIKSVGPNFLTLSSDGVPVSLMIANESEDEIVKALTISLLDKDLKPVKTITTDPIAFGAQKSTNINLAPMQVDIKPGDYFWTIDIDGKRASLSYPLIVTSEAKESNGVAYEVISEDRKIARVIPKQMSEYSGNVTIPESIDGYRITSVRNDSFTFADELTEVSIPSGVSDLEPGLFYCADALERINLTGNDIVNLWPETFAEGASEKIVLSPASGVANQYAATEAWSQFQISNWTIETAPECEITGGLLIDPLTNQYYSPYYIGADERLAINITTPQGTVINAEWELEDGEIGSRRFANVTALPALGGKSGKVRLSAVEGDGVEGITATDWVVCDVYSLNGTRVLTNATYNQFHALPSGLYILRGAKVLK